MIESDWNELIDRAETKLVTMRRRVRQLEALVKCFRRDRDIGELSPQQIARDFREAVSKGH